MCPQCGYGYGRSLPVSERRRTSHPWWCCRVITAYNVGLNKAVKLMRQLLPDYDGYECKEPEAGKITVAFRCRPCWGGWVACQGLGALAVMGMGRHLA